MKNLKTMLFFFLAIGITANAKTTNAPENENYNRYDGNAYIFVEGSVEFSVFPDGQFDFVYVGPQNGTEVVISTPNVNVSFNSGHDYEAYVQYDDYGAIIQVEDVPVFYDEYGRIAQAGTVDISYQNRRLVRVGGLHINYNNYGHYAFTTGFINPFNRIYVFRPWHTYYVRPIYSNCIVWDIPYRRYYAPVRYSYYHHITFYKNRHIKPYNNCRRDFYRPGSRIHYSNGRTAVNRDYREGRRNTMVNNHGRRTEAAVARAHNRVDARASTTARNNRGTVASNSRDRISANDSRRNVSTRSERGTTARTTADRNNTRGVISNRNERGAISRNTANRNDSRGITSDRNTRTSNARRPATTRNGRSANTSKQRGIATQSSRKSTTSRSTSTRQNRSKATSQRGIASNRTPKTTKQRTSRTSRSNASTPQRSAGNTSANAPRTSTRTKSPSRSTRTSSASKSSRKTSTPRRGRGL